MITLEDIKSVRPCWSSDALNAKWADRANTTYTEIASDLTVNINDRRWLMTQLAAKTRVGRAALILWAAGCAQDVRLLVREQDRDVTDAAIAAATAWAKNPTTENAARAAYAAARAADAADAARAAYAAARAADAAARAAYAADAARAAYAAAGAADAAADAADAAAGAAAYAAARAAQKQLNDLAAALEAL